MCPSDVNCCVNRSVLTVDAVNAQHAVDCITTNTVYCHVVNRFINFINTLANNFKPLHYDNLA